jgi:hypothetical protein
MAPKKENKLQKEEKDQHQKTLKEEHDAKGRENHKEEQQKQQHHSTQQPIASSQKDTTDTTYNYAKFINSPKELGISSNGSLATLSNDITGLIAYTDLLVDGHGKASKTGGPLGNKFFLATNSKCLENTSNQPVDRYIYLSNIPNGNIPLLSSTAGGDFTEFEGLIPGILSDLNNLSVPDPSEIFQTFENGGIPCELVNMEVIDVDNNKYMQSRYVALTDLKGMDPCLFPNNRNPVTNEGCSQLFTNLNKNKNENKNRNRNKMYTIPNNIIVQTYFLIFGLFLIYVLMKILFSKLGKRL